MLKLITVNIEREKHYDTVLPFLDKENADVICLQEVPEDFSQELHTLGYQTSFAPMSIQTINNLDITIGVMFASRLQYESRNYYYHKASSAIIKRDDTNKENTESFVYIMATIQTPETSFSIATTHMIDTRDGHKNDFQTRGMNNLLEALSQEEPHLICGDFNMPRGYNSLYGDMISKYSDCIPLEYKSSLDRNLHRFGHKILDQPIFDEYMVDYIFTQPPYKAKDVRLEFDISDHAAVIATISTNT